MLSNLLYLIDTTSLQIMVTIFTMTMAENGSVVLRYVKDLGPISAINEFIENAFVAVKGKDFQEFNGRQVNFVKTVHVQDAINKAVYLVDEGITEKVTFLGKGIVINKAQKKPLESEYLLSAIFENAIMQSKNVTTIIKGDQTHIFELYELKRNDEVSFEHIPKENDENINTKLNGIWYNENWKSKVIGTMNEYFLTKSELLIPNVKGEWKEQYEEGISFPYKYFFEEIPTYEEWKIFLKLPMKFITEKKAS